VERSRVKKIAIIVSSPGFVKAALTDQIEALSHIYHISLALNVKESDALSFPSAKVEIVAAPIVRHISILSDLRGLLFLVALFLRRKFDVVHSFTPKAGLLAALSGTITRIPVRIHTFTGQVWVTRSGPARLVLKTLDKLVAWLTTHALVDSPSQRGFLLREGVLSEKKSRVLANGSISGVDPARFRPNAEWKRKIRQLLRISDDGVVFLYVGRLKVDKGVLDLAQAFSGVSGGTREAWLLIVGPDEEGLQPRIEIACATARSRLRFVGLTAAPEEYMAAADVLCLPSYREGFGSVLIEAASAGLPAVASNIYGITDAIEPGATGLLHAPGDVNSLQVKMQKMIDDPRLRAALGREARSRAHRLFAKDLVMSALVEFYGSVVG
jgi:glycosyltransferase involved in cell wall biosynthesis